MTTTTNTTATNRATLLTVMREQRLTKWTALNFIADRAREVAAECEVVFVGLTDAGCTFMQVFHTGEVEVTTPYVTVAYVEVLEGAVEVREWAERQRERFATDERRTETMKTITTPVTNPYPEWQRTSDINCWSCYMLLWRKEQVERHLCDRCHEAGFVAVDDTVKEQR